MTTEEKARAYDEAMNKIKPLYEQAKKDGNPIWSTYEYLIPELTESEDERIRKEMIGMISECTNWVHKKEYVKYLEKQKENPKSADSIPSDCMSDAKCEDRWHKVEDSLPNNGRMVLANDCLGNTLLARYDGEGNWEVSVYDNEDYYCRNTITKWCEIPSEKQKERKPEWSEEDERMISTLVSYVEDPSCWNLNCPKEKLVSFLKSLRPQPHWKPSEVQIKALEDAFRKDGSDEYRRTINSLYQDLKKPM